MLTPDDILNARRISQAIQDYFDRNNIRHSLRSTEVYEILVRINKVEKDRHSGVKFREFLNKLRKHNALDQIPQCRAVQENNGKTSWYFESCPGKTIRIGNLVPKSEADNIHKINEAAIRRQVATFDHEPLKELTIQQQETRIKYPRAYARWSKEEEALLMEVYKLNRNPLKLGELFGRQPSAIENRCKRYLGVDL